MNVASWHSPSAWNIIAMTQMRDGCAVHFYFECRHAFPWKLPAFRFHDFTCASEKTAARWFSTASSSNKLLIKKKNVTRGSRIPVELTPCHLRSPAFRGFLPERWKAYRVTFERCTRAGCPLGLPPCNIDPWPNFVLRSCHALRHTGHLESNRKHRSTLLPSSRRFRANPNSKSV